MNNYAKDCSWSLMSSYHMSLHRTREEQRQHYENRVATFIRDAPIFYILKCKLKKLLSFKKY